MKKIFSIFDSRALAFLQPFHLPSQAHAIRTVSEAMQEPNSIFADYPEDFTLFEIGSFDELTGELQPMLMHSNLGNLLRLKNELQQRRAKNLQPEGAV